MQKANEGENHIVFNLGSLKREFKFHFEVKHVRSAKRWMVQDLVVLWKRFSEKGFGGRAWSELDEDYSNEVMQTTYFLKLSWGG